MTAGHAAVVKHLWPSFVLAGRTILMCTTVWIEGFRGGVTESACKRFASQAVCPAAMARSGGLCCAAATRAHFDLSVDSVRPQIRKPIIAAVGRTLTTLPDKIVPCLGLGHFPAMYLVRRVVGGPKSPGAESARGPAAGGRWAKKNPGFLAHFGPVAQ